MLQQLPMLHVVLLLSRLHLVVGGCGVLQADGRGAGGTSARQAQQRHSGQQHQEAWKRTTTGASILWRTPTGTSGPPEDTNRNIRTPGGHQQENSEPWRSTTTRTLDDNNRHIRNPERQQLEHQEPCRTTGTPGTLEDNNRRIRNLVEDNSKKIRNP